MVKFDVSRRDAKAIQAIAKRAMDLTVARENDPYSRMDVAMDVTAVHANGCPLRLDALRAADDFNFAHDVLGIRRHLDRETGKLADVFCPRFAA